MEIIKGTRQASEMNRYHSYVEDRVAWHESLARKGIETTPNVWVIPNNRTSVLRDWLKLESPPHEFSDIPNTVWQHDNMTVTRGHLWRVHEAADTFFKGIPYAKPRKVIGPDNTPVDENPNVHGARASYFALKYLGITDPVIHALIRFHDYHHYIPKKYSQDAGPSSQKRALQGSLQPLIQRRVLPETIYSLLEELESDDDRCRQVADAVSRDQNIPSGSEIGSNHTPESFWALYRHITVSHTSDYKKATSSYRSFLSLFGEAGEGTDSGLDKCDRVSSGERIDGSASVSLREYQKYVAKIALAYEKYRHPKVENANAMSLQKEALSVLMELWPVARGLDEGILSRYVGECVGMAFMPEAYRNLGGAAQAMFPGDEVEQAQQRYAEWARSTIASVLPESANYLTTTEMIHREYLMLRGGLKSVSWGPHDVYVPGENGQKDLLTSPYVVDIKTRSSVFWKMLEIWNDRGERGKYLKLTDEARGMEWGSHEFWRWAIANHHDIFRTQVLLLGTDIQHRISEMGLSHKLGVLDPTINFAKTLFPKFRDEEIFEIKKSRMGAVINIMFGYEGIPNLEMQIKDAAAYFGDSIEPGYGHHSVYKTRVLRQWVAEHNGKEWEDNVVDAVARGSRALRIAHLAGMYGFEDEMNKDPKRKNNRRFHGPTMSGEIFQSK